MLKLFFSCLLIIINGAAIAQKNSTVSGQIIDKNNNGIEGVAIYLLNTNNSFITDKNGNFEFNSLPDGRYTIEISALNFETQYVMVNTNESASKNLIFILKESTNKLDDIIVTTQKKEELLQQTPISITAISSKDISQYRLWDIKDVTAIAANTYASNPGDYRNITSVRGITSASYDPAVATYIDGVSQFSLDTYIGNLLDIERIEIARGPQGTLYGRNAMGGVINIITKKPNNFTEGFVELNLGNFNQQRYSLGLRTPLIKNKLFFGASGMFNKQKGYYTNEFNNSSFDDQHSFAGNYFLKFIPNSTWTINLNAKHQNNINSGAFPLVYGVENALNKPYTTSQNAVSKMKDKTVNVSLGLNHTGKGFGFNSQTAWQENYRYYTDPLDADFSEADAITLINNFGNQWNKVKVFTQEIKFTAPPKKTTALNWIAGAYFFYQNNPSKQAIHFGEDAALIGAPDINFSTITTAKAKNTGVSVYGQMSYFLNKELELTGGLRYDYENKNLMVMGAYQKDGAESFITQPDTAGRVRFSALSPKLSLNYHAGINNILFASYSRGYRTGGLTQLSSDPSQPPLYPFNPEYSNAFELGNKNTLFQKHLHLNITAFLTSVNDVQVPTLILPDAITVTKNTGKLVSSGFELEAASTPVKGFELDYNFGYTHAKFRSLKISQNGQETNLDNKTQIFTPEITSMLAVQYSYVLGKKNEMQLVVRGEWFYLGKQYFDLANSIAQDPYSLFNTRIGISSKKADLFFWGRNITGKKYVSYAYNFGAVHLGNPAIFGITLSTKFNNL